MNMARKDRAGLYQIGIWTVERRGRRWFAESECILGRTVLRFDTLEAAHIQLTGEPRRERAIK